MSNKILQNIKLQAEELFITTFSVILAAWLLKNGIHIGDPKLSTGFIIALTFILVNMFIRPLLILLTIPISIASYGLFILFINAFVIELVDFTIDKFTVDNFGWAMLFSIIVSLTTSILSGIQHIKITTATKNKSDDDFTHYEEID